MMIIKTMALVRNPLRMREPRPSAGPSEYQLAHHHHHYRHHRHHPHHHHRHHHYHYQDYHRGVSDQPNKQPTQCAMGSVFGFEMFRNEFILVTVLYKFNTKKITPQMKKMKHMKKMNKRKLSPFTLIVNQPPPHCPNFSWKNVPTIWNKFADSAVCLLYFSPFENSPNCKGIDLEEAEIPLQHLLSELQQWHAAIDIIFRRLYKWTQFNSSIQRTLIIIV